ncbi:hypothetical protein C7N43_02775 [Sphingobacteriales bacterium UPWRP_1]|nr:hypothetical protein C7N43_02775 [Sphingobacteriales bacterium UPWRP_1]
MIKITCFLNLNYLVFLVRGVSRRQKPVALRLNKQLKIFSLQVLFFKHNGLFLSSLIFALKMNNIMKTQNFYVDSCPPQR